MKKYFSVEEAIKESKNDNSIIPSEFLSVFPNNFGVNLCGLKGIEIEMTDDNQYKTIRIDFNPVEKRMFEKDNYGKSN